MLLGGDLYRMPSRSQFKQLVKTGLVGVGAARALRPVLGGRGVFVLFHEVQLQPADELATGASTDYFERLLRWMQREGWTFVSVDEALRRYRSPESHGRFAALTFDDGYRDNLSLALPIAERLGVPLCVFVPTGAVTRELDVWWLVLRHIIRTRSRVDVQPMGIRLECDDLRSKVAALQRVTIWIMEEPARLTDITSWLASQAVSPAAMVERYFMDAEQLRMMARHPLVTIGAHTTSHRPLSMLSDAGVSAEIKDNKVFLESLLDRPIEHLAYPFGVPTACGPREFDLAQRTGFQAAYTTASQVVRATGLQSAWSLPRFDCGRDTSIALQDYRLSGLQR